MDNLLKKIGRLDSLSMKRRKRIIWKSRELFRIPDKEFEIDFYGLRYKGTTGNQIDKYVYYFGAYEKGLLKFIENSLKASNSKVFVDIGANVGHHTLFASKFASHIFSFEPYEAVRKKMEEKLLLNNIKNVEVFPFALGEDDQELTYYEPTNKNTGTGSFVEGYLAENQNKGLKLKVRNGTKVFEEFGIKNVSLIKIDTEGFEPLILSGLLEVLKLSKPTIIMEYSKTSQAMLDSRPALLDFIKTNYKTVIFENPNELIYKLLPWDFDKLGNVVLFPK